MMVDCEYASVSRLNRSLSRSLRGRADSVSERMGHMARDLW
jgi:hypothetical protein